MKNRKIAFAFDDWAEISEALAELGERDRKPRLLLLSAEIGETIGLTTVAASYRDRAAAIQAAQ